MSLRHSTLTLTKNYKSHYEGRNPFRFSTTSKCSIHFMQKKYSQFGIISSVERPERDQELTHRCSNKETSPFAADFSSENSFIIWPATSSFVCPSLLPRNEFRVPCFRFKRGNYFLLGNFNPNSGKYF
ncbi:hypothetical protein NPIL_443871 [Nephila pilipes]|uniref:Uncharacterized protein n=1 Tax=Nephila pilipes TaxID=299642 RepID=A0A8X6MUY2_NEPPI|nr:hypothetical protein NPIL_443871 [Nephila pilipes]